MTEKKAFIAHDRAAAGGPVSKREINLLRERRESPAPVLDYKLGESTGQVMRKLDVLRAERAHHVESRLRQNEGRAENEFALAGVAGRATHDFDRSR